MDRSLEKTRRRMVALLNELAPVDGLHATMVNGVFVRRAERNLRRTPVMYEPSVYFVASGRKKGYVGARRLVYDANNYLVLSAPLPFECECEAIGGLPLLGFSVRMDAEVVGELTASMSIAPARPSADAIACVHATPLDAALSDAAVRLLECLSSPSDAAVLGPAIKREIAYRVLRGPRGATLAAMLGRGDQAGRIHAVLQQMHARYAEPLSVPSLAREVGMSVSGLHHGFKAVTSTSPVQYLKSVRLHKAQQLLLYDGIGAAAAAHLVGYESASQFSREFKRLFGTNPIGAAKRTRGRHVAS